MKNRSRFVVLGFLSCATGSHSNSSTPRMDDKGNKITGNDFISFYSAEIFFSEEESSSKQTSSHSGSQVMAPNNPTTTSDCLTPTGAYSRY